MFYFVKNIPSDKGFPFMSYTIEVNLVIIYLTTLLSRCKESVKKVYNTISEIGIIKV